ncbi:CMRF35-like molecule 1 [Sinocyclocheilus rhinocerous]|uniref:CMRF35-like molecule 1 n=1 Tax=Sinocyclocheilus rhinocerous TaxID=307959 RepID=UPI0007B8FCDB|nr:PREDICTED: CMRF35-like molecule 1 [Sinocyclocheilus rhinocerous]
MASTNIKYFCREPCEDRDVLVKSDQSPTGRYTLKDHGAGTFTVSITDLQESDSGIYWCAVDRSVKDTYKKVKLTVSNALDTNRPTTPKPAASSQSSMTQSSFSTSSASGDTTTSSSTGFKGPVVSSKPAFNESSAQYSLSSVPLIITAIGLTVMVIIFGVVGWRKSHSYDRFTLPNESKAEDVSDAKDCDDRVYENGSPETNSTQIKPINRTTTRQEQKSQVYSVYENSHALYGNLWS